MADEIFHILWPLFEQLSEETVLYSTDTCRIFSYAEMVILSHAFISLNYSGHLRKHSYLC